MIIGNGQLAQTFKNLQIDNVVIFASGVSNSNCKDENEFNREKKLLIQTLELNKDKRFIYFSSSALSAKEYPKNDYYQHKENIEKIIKKYSKNYYIFRIPQLFGELKSHNTLINFIYDSIINDRKFKVYSEAYRYVVEISDVRLLVEEYLKFSESNILVDLANDYKYNVEEIVKIFEGLLKKKANYELVEKVDKYDLDLSSVSTFIKEHNININFSKDYLKNKLSEVLNH